MNANSMALMNIARNSGRISANSTSVCPRPERRALRRRIDDRLDVPALAGPNTSAPTPIPARDVSIGDAVHRHATAFAIDHSALPEGVSQAAP
jgi:hypothetical protein